MDKKTVAATSGLTAAAVAIAAALIGGFEGKRNQPYRDPVGILTVCYGHTGKDIEQRRYSDAECLAMLEKDIERHAPALDCIKTPLQPREKIAFLSFAFNIGTAKFCGGSGYKTSTVVKKANAGDMQGACEGMKAWRNGRINGKLVPLDGLVKRREVEAAICVGDYAKAARVLREWGMSAAAQAVEDIPDIEADEQDAPPQEAPGDDCRCDCTEGGK